MLLLLTSCDLISPSEGEVVVGWEPSKAWDESPFSGLSPGTAPPPVSRAIEWGIKNSIFRLRAGSTWWVVSRRRSRQFGDINPFGETRRRRGQPCFQLPTFPILFPFFFQLFSYSFNLLGPRGPLGTPSLVRPSVRPQEKSRSPLTAVTRRNIK